MGGSRFTFHKIYYKLTQNIRKGFGGPICFSIQIDKNINKLSSLFNAKILPAKLLELERLLILQSQMESTEFDECFGLKHSTKKRSTLFKIPANDGRIFSNYFAHVIVHENKERVILLMRYRIRQSGSKEEIPTKFNVFNARLDSLEIRPTWQPLFMRQHGLIPMSRFYEWVPGPDRKPKLISFFPEKRETMWAPCLWDEWISKDGKIFFKSFAIITDGPPEEIQKMGHDRCPIFLAEDKIDDWLSPVNLSKKDVYNLLSNRESIYFNYSWV